MRLFIFTFLIKIDNIKIGEAKNKFIYKFIKKEGIS